MTQAAETQAVETQEAAKTVSVAIGLYNALEALAPGWQTAWTPQQVELARNLYALGMRDVQIFANKSLENVMEGYQAAVINLKEGSDWLIADLGKPAAIQAAMAAETAKQAAADAASTATGTVDLGAAEEPATNLAPAAEVADEAASDLDVEEQEYQERMNNAVQAEVDASHEEAGREEETDHGSEAPVPDEAQPVSETAVQAAETAPAEVAHQPV